MKELLKYNPDSEYIFVDIAELVRQKIKIPLLYDHMDVNGNSDGMHNLSKKLDKYILNIVEEIVEFREELHSIRESYNKDLINTEEYKPVLMELIDVIAYIVSILSILYLDIFGIETINDTNYFKTSYNIVKNRFSHFFDPRYRFNCIKPDSNDRDDLMSYIDYNLLLSEEYLIDMRRLFPERKWHYNTNRSLSIDELTNLYMECVKYTIYALETMIDIFLNFTNFNTELFATLFITKNEEVYNICIANKEKKEDS